MSRRHPAPLIGATLSPQGIEPAILEDATSSAVVDRSKPHVLKASADMLSRGGITLEAAKTISLAKKTIDSATQFIIGRYAMTVLLPRDPVAPESLANDLLSTAYRASAISVLDAARRMVDSDKQTHQFEKFDRTWIALSKQLSDTRQFTFLKKPVVRAVLNDALQLLTARLGAAQRAYEKHDIHFAEPELYQLTCNVFVDSGKRLGLTA